MPFKIVRNDITKMNTEAIVNTANEEPMAGTGCDFAIYQAAGYEELLAYRKEKIGHVPEGEVFLTPGFRLPAKWIIHAVSPLYIDGNHKEEELLRSCYRKSLALAAEKGIRSISFPLISTGGFGYPREEGMRIAVDEIHAFLLIHDMQICLVVFNESSVRMGKNLYPDLEAYIDRNYVEQKLAEEYGEEPYDWAERQAERRTEAARPSYVQADHAAPPAADYSFAAPMPPVEAEEKAAPPAQNVPAARRRKPSGSGILQSVFGRREKEKAGSLPAAGGPLPGASSDSQDAAIEEMERKLKERIAHRADTFQQYLFYLIGLKGLENADVYKRAIVDKKVFSKIKNNQDYHPQKLTALCLCVGAKLNLDETRDLLARAGYALSPCDKTDIIFSYFIENGIYDMIELDIQLEEHGLPCIIS